MEDGKKKIFKMNPPEINLLELSEKDLAVKVREVLGVVKGFDDEWYYCNDSKIKKVGRPISKEDTENAYMLFYQK